MSSANLDSADLQGVAYGGLINEDVMQQIWDISKVPLPISDMIGTDDCDNSYKEWTTDELAAPDTTNAVIDGSDASGNDTATGARVGNHCQISTKVVRVSTRADNSDTIGRSNELAYQVMQRQRELRRDIEAIILTQQASVGDTGSAAGTSAGLGAWLETSAYRGVTGTDGGFASGVVAAPGPGTARGLTETLLRDCVQSVYEEGGDPSILTTTPTIKRLISEYLFTSSARIATLTSETGSGAEAATAKGAVDIFVTDYGTLDLLPNRLQQVEDATHANVYVIDPMHLRIGYLHGYRTEPLAKTGLAENRQMAVDWTLIVTTEKAHGVIADVNPATAMAA